MLRDVQQVFANSLIENDVLAATRVRSGKLTSERRLEVYRHNVFTNLRGALGDIFPVVKRIVGEVFFLHAADQFIRAHPSRSGDLNQFGHEWPDFLAAYPHAEDLPYLADVARLEWAWHECFHAAEAAPLDLARLAELPPEAHGSLVFGLHPAVRLAQSEFPILRIWQVNQEQFTGDVEIDMGIDWEIDWETTGDCVLVRRDNAGSVDVVMEAIETGAYRFLSELQQQRTLEVAADAALAIDGAFDLQGFLLESVQCGVIVDFKRDKE